MAIALEVLLIVVVVVGVLIAIVRDPDPVEPAPLESAEPRDAIRSAIERRRG